MNGITVGGAGAPLTDLSRLSLNQMTTAYWSLREAIEGCVRAGIPYLGAWRHKVAEIGLAESVRLVRESGVKISSLCRGGMFPASSAAERQKRLDDNFRAVDEAAALGAGTLVLVCGPAPDRDIESARAMVEEAMERLVPYAQQRGVTLGIEPLHPMFAADRSVIVTLAQANRIAQRFAAEQVGVVVDAYHVWWDPEVYREIERARGRIVGFHVSDWVVPLPHPLNGRGMMGDGVIELRRLRSAVEACGYAGPIEVEIFNEALWALPGDEILRLIKERYLAYV